jgi:sporulation protein YlmC with PRC-barrel domain
LHFIRKPAFDESLYRAPIPSLRGSNACGITVKERWKLYFSTVQLTGKPTVYTNLLLKEMNMNYQDSDPLGIYKNSTGNGPGPHLMGANTLIGNDVYDHNDEDLGEIKEIMLGMHSGKVAYAVLSFGGFLGMGEKLFAVPWAALTLDTENKRFVLKVDKDTLKDAPGFDEDNWPNMADESWTKEIHSYYGIEPDPDDTFRGRGM